MHGRFVAAMNVPGGGKNDIPNRLKRQFAIFYVPPPSPVAVNTIFGALVQASLLSSTLNLGLTGRYCMSSLFLKLFAGMQLALQAWESLHLRENFLLLTLFGLKGSP